MKTEEEIIKALECCRIDRCDSCPFCDDKDWECDHNLPLLTIDLIKRQQAEIKRLQSQVNRLKKYDEERDIALHARLIKNAKSEAIKEFVMKLKCGVPQETGAIRCSDIDNLVKEMVGEGND